MDPASPTMAPTTSSLRSVDKYAQLVLQQMNKMRTRLEFCDLHIHIGPAVFGAHKLLLAASSPYFAALLSGGLKESSCDVVRIQGVEAAIFQLLLDFIYSGSVLISPENVQELMTAADMLQLNQVVALCCDFLKEQIDPGNCIGFFQFSEQLSCQPLLEFTESYIQAHFPEVQQGDEFQLLTKEQLIRLLRSEELCIEDEHQVFAAAMSWLQKDTTARKRHVVEVLEPVRFSLLPPQRLQKNIEEVTDFSLRVALQTLLREYCEPSLSPKDKKLCSFLQTSRVRPRRKARKFLYAIGGYTRLQGGRWSDSRALSCVERFDTFSQYWSTVSSLHQARSGMSAAVLEGRIYVVGGEKDSMIFDCVECYDPVTKQWSAVPSMNQPRCGLGVCSCHGAIYAMGGWVGAEIGNGIERFSPEDNAWQIVGQMAVPRYNFACCERQGLIYVVGGISHAGIELSSVEVFDPITRRWTSLPPMATRRAYLGAACLDDCLFAVGGWDEHQDSLNTVEKFSFEEEKWVEVAPMRIRRAGVSVISVNGLLYAAGGRANVQNFSAPVTSDSVEVYNPHTDSWTEIGSMITSRCEGSLAVL
ncbi:actin-binding protein IPP isoform X1 [Hyla sarda]|uniref:actin-binding protein IPP isoform X1 n=1 Tax=Hyla sarda TaxID=327740 RepID=UPI0024C3CD61|nr:actin-binding protein IPP isoform X1 [Hyla sarda]XP_056389058.1 actin-binding protein IPP isoform X1 [Hyla sarda]